MEARLLRCGVLIAAVLSLGASYRTQNFLVTAATPQLAREVCEEAERFRRELAVEWLGRELPPWPAPCPIQVKVSPELGAGGATSFAFANGYPMDWRMEVFGSRERVLDSVLPHEVMHTVFATHFGQPLPRWADEGACTTVEHEIERSKHKQMLIRFLTTGKGIPFNRMFAMKQYPPEMLPLYAQGYSVARYLIAQGGKQKFVAFIGDGMRTNNWHAAVRKHYAFRDLSELQLTWVDWVGKGSPDLSPDPAAIAAEGLRSVQGQSPDRIAPAAYAAPLEDVPAESAPVRPAVLRNEDRLVPPANHLAEPAGRSWYAAQRDATRQNRAAGGPQPVSQNRQGQPSRLGLEQGEQPVMEWRRGQPLPQLSDQRALVAPPTVLR